MCGWEMQEVTGRHSVHVQAINGEAIVVRLKEAFRFRHNQPLRHDTRVVILHAHHYNSRIILLNWNHFNAVRSSLAQSALCFLL